jgi:hypothetical protein
MVKWIHHLLDPHCPDCALERAQNKVCESCSTLRIALANAQDENRRLMNALIEMSRPQPVAPQPIPSLPTDYKPTNRVVPWHVQQRMLEAEDRVTAAKLREAAQTEIKAKANQTAGKSTEESIAELEAELGVNEEAK